MKPGKRPCRSGGHPHPAAGAAAGRASQEPIGLQMALDPERKQIRTRLIPDFEEKDTLFFRLGMEIPYFRSTLQV